jgi:hypothetical protein
MDTFNADNFRRWMKNHTEETETIDMTGFEVQAKYHVKKIMNNMCVESGSPGKVIREFMDNGGTIKSISGNEYLIKVASGEFTINKKFVIA